MHMHTGSWSCDIGLYDADLTSKGCFQARNLHANESLLKVLAQAADQKWGVCWASSPLTRALRTSMLALEGTGMRLCDHVILVRDDDSFCGLCVVMLLCCV